MIGNLLFDLVIDVGEDIVDAADGRRTFNGGGGEVLIGLEALIAICSLISVLIGDATALVVVIDIPP